MTRINEAQLIDTIRATQTAYHKLTILVGETHAGKTPLLKRIAMELDLPVLNLGLPLSQRLLSKSRRQISLQSADIATELIDEHISKGICIDNTELLFQGPLKMDPLAFFEKVSRNRYVIATWNGTFVNGELRFGEPGHPDHFHKAAAGYPVVAVKENELELHLTA